jgi:cold shock protein
MAAGIQKLTTDKRFGFIQNGDGDDVFFHGSVVKDEQFDDLREGQRVEYTVEQGGGPKMEGAASGDGLSGGKPKTSGWFRPGVFYARRSPAIPMTVKLRL